MSLRFRHATVEDLPSAVALLRSRDLPVLGFADLVRAHPTHVLIAELNDAVVGCAALEVCDQAALLRSVAVARDLATLGVGTRLVTDMLTVARHASLQAVYLLTTTAEGWFPRFGFQPVARTDVPASIASTIEFTKACPSSATAMMVSLADLQP